MLKNNTKIYLNHFNHILVYSLNYIGDTLFTTPVYKTIKDLNPDIKTTVVVGNQGGYNILKDNPYIDRILVFNKSGTINKYNFLKQELSNNIPKIALILDTSFQSALICFLLGIKYRIGLVTELRGLLLTHKTKTDNTHIVDKYFSNMYHFTDDITHKKMSFFINENEVNKNKFNFDMNKIKIGIVPGTTNLIKKYSDDKYREFIELSLNIDNSQIYIIGDNDALISAKNICDSIGNKQINNYVCLSSNLSELGFILKNMNIVIGSDTGPLHIANALGIPCIFLFGPTSHIKTGPFNKENSVALYPKNKFDRNVNNINPELIYKTLLKLI
jgi:heptosyltransferase-2